MKRDVKNRVKRNVNYGVKKGVNSDTVKKGVNSDTVKKSVNSDAVTKARDREQRCQPPTSNRYPAFLTVMMWTGRAGSASSFARSSDIWMSTVRVLTSC